MSSSTSLRHVTHSLRCFTHTTLSSRVMWVTDNVVKCTINKWKKITCWLLPISIDISHGWQEIKTGKQYTVCFLRIVHFCLSSLRKLEYLPALCPQVAIKCLRLTESCVTAYRLGQNVNTTMFKKWTCFYIVNTWAWSGVFLINIRISRLRVLLTTALKQNLSLYYNATP
jgi:hypothetical protein